MNALKMKYFIDVANFKSFTKAAQHNYVSQTAVSQQIAAFERDLEVRLFTREKGKVELTLAGEAFYEDCSRFIAEYERSVSNAKRIQNENGGTISVGFLTATKLGFLSKIISIFHETYPDVEIKLVQSSFSSLRKGLDSGELDVALSGKYNLEEIENVKIEPLVTLKMGLLVSQRNPLAKNDEISVKDIADEPIVMISRKFAGRVYDHMLEQRRLEGYEPNIVETADSSEILTMLVELNRGSAFLPEKVSIYNKDQCKLLHVKDNKDYFDFVVAWRNVVIGAALGHFIECIKSFYENDFDAWVEEHC